MSVEHEMSSPVEGNSQAGQPRRRRSSLARAADIGLIVLLVAFAPGLWIIWNVWQPGMDQSVQNLASKALAGLVVLSLLGWWWLFAPVSRRTRLMVGLPVLLVLGVGVACIRSVEFRGHMTTDIIYRWDADPQQVLAEHLREANVAEGEAATELTVPEVTPEDSPAYRGINRDGLVIGPPLSQDWTANPPKELWRQPCGGGYGTFAIVGDFLVSLEQRGDEEAIVCYDAATGKQRWEERYKASFFEAMGGAGPRSTPTIDRDAVYSLGAFGDAMRCDLLTGKRRWHVNLLEQFKQPNNIWAMSSSPLIYEEDVIFNIGGKEGNGVVSMDIDHGDTVEFTPGLPTPDNSPFLGSVYHTGGEGVPAGADSRAGYSSPMLVNFLGTELILNLDGAGLHAYEPESLKEFFHVAFGANPWVNVAQPILFDDGRIFLSASYGIGCRMVQVEREGDVWSTKTLWENQNMRCKFTSPVLVDGYIYGLDEGIMVCLDPATGERKWKGGKSGLRGRYDHGQILVTNGQILALTEFGVAVLIDPSPEGLQEVTSLRVLPDTKVWNPPMLSRGKLYVRCSSGKYSEMACFDLNAP